MSRAQLLIVLGLSGMGLSRAAQRVITTAGLQDADPFTLTALSLVLGAAAMLAWLTMRRQISFDRKLWLFALPLGTVNIALPAIGFTLGQQHLSTGAAGLFGAAVPVAVAAMAAIALGERLTWRGWAGLALAAAAVSSLALGAEGGSTGLIGVAWSVMAVGSAAWAYVMIRRSNCQFKVSQLLFTQVCWSTLLLVPAAFLLGHPASTPVSLELTLLVAGLAGTCILLPQALMTWMLGLTDASKVAVANYIVPIATAGLAWVLLSESPSLHLLLAGAVAVTGAWIVNRDRFVSVAPSTEPEESRYRPLVPSLDLASNPSKVPAGRS